MHVNPRVGVAFALVWFVVPGISFAQTQSVASLQAELQSLIAEVTSLEARLAAAEPSTTVAWCYTFTNNLSIGMSGDAITQLQTSLRDNGESVRITGTFDDQTAAAVTAFQEKYQRSVLAPYGLSHGTGYAGKSTRAELNSLFGCGGTTNSTPVTPPIFVNPITPASTSPIVCPAWGCNGPEPVAPPVSISTSTVLTASVNNVALSGVPGTNYSQSIQLNNSDNATATWSAIVSSNWISLNYQGNANALTGGSLSPGWGTTFVVTANVPSVAAGAMIPGTVTITGNFPTLTIPISFTNTAATQAPSVSQVQGLTATVAGSSITLNWQAATASDGVSTYDVYRTFLTSVCSANPADLIARVNSGLVYTDTSLPAGTYYYCVAAQDVNGLVGPLSSQVTGTISSTSSASPLTLQLDSANPAAAQVQTGASGVPLLAFDITNPLGDAVRVTGITASETLRPISQSTLPQFNNVTLYDTTSGSNVLLGTFPVFPAPQNALETTDATINLSSLNIPANSTHKFLITGNVPMYVNDPAIVGTSGAFAIPNGSEGSVIAIDANTNAIAQVSGLAQGNMMTIVQGQ
jgi:Putative peptidoglycan binding domain